VGDHPKHAIGFEKGLFFDALRAGCDAAAKEEARLKLIKTLVCDAPVHHILRDGKREMTPCNGLISKFECCDSCQRTHPKLKNAFRIIVEGDPRWKEIEVWKCLACRNSCPATNPLCERCGNQRPRNVPRRRQPRKYLIFLFQGGVLPPTVNFLDWFAEEEDEDDEDQQEDE
jgi:hypothetical protein